MVATAAIAGACDQQRDASTISEPVTSHRRVAFDFAPGPVSPTGYLTNHGGYVSTSPAVYAIFWGPQWGTDGAFTGDKVTALQSLFNGLGGTSYLGILNQYGVGSQFSLQATYYDPSSPPALGENSNPSLTPYVTSEVCSVLTANGVTPSTQAIYEVFSTNPPFDGSAFAYHQAGTCSGVTIHWGYIWNLDQYSSSGGRNNPSDMVSDSLHSDSAAALASIATHELAEAMSDGDPNNLAWYDQNGLPNGEVADKCNFVFAGGYVPLTNGDRFKLQALWSNQAYGAYGGGTGFPNAGSEYGCSVQQPLPVPANVTGTVVSGAATLTWSSVPNAAGYHIYNGNSNDTGQVFLLATTSSTTFADSSHQYLAAKVTLGFKDTSWVSMYVTAYNNSGSDGYTLGDGIASRTWYFTCRCSDPPPARLRKP